MKIVYEANPKQEDVQTLGSGVMQYALQQKGLGPLHFLPFLFVMKTILFVAAAVETISMVVCILIPCGWKSRCAEKVLEDSLSKLPKHMAKN